MQQRQYRPGDVLDDYCPRERRVTDHAIVAMVEGAIQRTRCVVCDAEHEFKNARVPPHRRKASSAAALFTQVLDSLDGQPGRVAAPVAADEESEGEGSPPGPGTAVESEPISAESAAPPGGEPSADPTDDRPFRRSLIRAQLPRPEGQPPPTRVIPEFTMHQPLSPRGNRGPGRFRRRPGAGLDGGGASRFGREQGGGSAPGHGQGQGHRRRRRKKH